MSGTQTWIRVPARQYRPEWKGKNMVVPLKKALYGHPPAGVYWEQRCNTAITEAGFAPVGDCGEWRSCFFHPKLEVFLMVYVDGFKLTGPAAAVDKRWEPIKQPVDQYGDQMIKLAPLEPVKQFLGWQHEVHEMEKDGKSVKV